MTKTILQKRITSSFKEFQKKANKLYLVGAFLVIALTSFSQIPSVCVGGTQQLTGVNPNSNNPWFSTNTNIATVSSSGLVTGVSNGSCNIIFTNVSGTSFPNSVTVISTISTITLTSSVASTNQIVTGSTPFTNITYSINQNACIGLLSGSFPAGIYGSFNNGVYTISGTPLEAGVFNYTLTATGGDCGFDGVTVSGTITSYVASICASNSTQLPIVGTPNSVNPWVSNSTSIATVSSTGLVTGISTGTTTIVYTDNNSISTTYTIYVNNPININPITGVTTICVNYYSDLNDLTLGGTWSSSNTSIATVNSYGTVHGVSQGTCVISYTASPNGCAVTVTTPFTVVASGSPATLVVSSAVGTNHQTLNVNHVSNDTIYYNPLTPIVYTMGGGATNIHFITGVTNIPLGVTGVYSNGVFTISGTPFIVYTNPYTPTTTVYNYSVTTSGGVYCADYGTLNGACCVPGDVLIGDSIPPANPILTGDITLNPPCIGIISGYLPNGCQNMNYYATLSVTGSPSTVTVSGLPAGLNYYYSNGIITITGTAFSLGYYNVSVFVNGGVCIPGSYSGGINIEPSNVIMLNSAIGTDNQTICTGSQLTSIDYSTFGSSLFVSGNLPTGISSYFNGQNLIISGTPTQSGTFYYTIMSNSMCVDPVQGTITVVATPVLQNISGSSTLCVNSTTSLSCSPTGGTWSCSPSNIASISSSGVVTGNAAGTATVTYTKSNGNCVASKTYTITVVSPVQITISGPTGVCVGSSINLTASSSSNITWSSSNTSVATVNPNGVVTGVSDGSVSIICGNTSGNCPSSTSYAVTVTSPVDVQISGPTTFCVNDTIILTASISGGTWSTPDLLIATIDNSGQLIGAEQGVVTVTYTIQSGSCTTIDTYSVTVNAPVVLNEILGSNELCIGSSLVLTNSTSGGIWTSSNLSVAEIDSYGNVTSVSSGTSVITYSVDNNGCLSEVMSDLEVNDTLTPIFSAAPILCKGSHNYSLPLISENESAVTGTWSPIFSTSGTGTTVYTFTPDPIYGPCVNTATMAVTVVSAPIANFTYVITGNTVQFTNTTPNSSGASFYWDFGNSTNSTLENPSCTYSGTGTYTVILNFNNGCEDSEINQIYIGTDGLSENEVNELLVYPNPFTNELTISLLKDQESEVLVCDLTGKTVFESNFNSQEIKVNLESLVNGQYLLKIKQNDKVSVKLITKN